MTMTALPLPFQGQSISTSAISARVWSFVQYGIKQSLAGLNGAGQYRSSAVGSVDSSLDTYIQDLLALSSVAPTIETTCILSDGELVSRDYCVRAYAALEHYRTLVDGWDGDDALAPTSECLEAADAFLYMLGSIVERCPDVSAMLDEEGIPGLFWDTGLAYFSVSFYGGHELACVYRNRETGQKTLFEANLHHPEELEQAWAFIESL
ncbi:hypothetical protein EF096_15850 [Pseudomonas neustonica]|uniref:SMI1/KNR4 family protein n=2 Tax=Pseudomonas TaxID=286 RepID=A0ABX9XES6_9PSED|nr:hypothetical protein EF099_16315 [Pseudomonas sp. SSM44]ROZ82132.1 hypothetical protein EF096_15850 [Pseudomonas neustonica]|tara:strand:+ start:995 stop:1618 length:624 start_codon:yes stop_codon:yes gene_type:complete